MTNQHPGISAAIPVWLAILGVAAAALFAWWSYSHTRPPAPRVWQWTLIILRWGALTTGLLFLARPALEITHHHKESAKIAVLLDKSASMTLGYGIDKQQQIVSLFQSGAFHRLGQRNRLMFYSFSESVNDSFLRADDLVSDPAVGVGTNLGASWMAAMERGRNEPPAGILLVTDGAHNSGPDPLRAARSSRAPIWTVGVGTTQPARDIAVTGVNVTPTVYQGSKVPVEIPWRAIGADGEKTALTLLSGGRVVSRQNADIHGEHYDGLASFELTADRAGHLRFTVTIDTLTSELTADNNRRSFYLNVLPSRMKVLLVAGPPDNGSGDLIRRLRSDEHVDLITRVTRGAGFYEGGWLADTALAGLDAIILNHFPVKTTNAHTLEALIAAIAKYNIPVCFIDGGDTDYRLLAKFDSRLPVTINKNAEKTAGAQALPVRRHAIIAEPEETDYTSGWSELPPLEFSPGLFKIKPQAEVLAEFTGLPGVGNYPAIAVLENGGIKSVAVLGRDLWRWRLADSPTEPVWKPLLERLVRWLAIRRSAKQVQIQFDKEIYTTQEPVSFVVSVVDESFQPVDRAFITATVQRDSLTGGAVKTEGVSDGRYRGSFNSWGEGEYSLNVAASQDGESIGSDSAHMAVETFSVEMLDTRLNDELLKSIATATGGEYAPAERSDSLLNGINLPPVTSDDTVKYELKPCWWLLSLMTGLLAIEWLIRIRLGML